MHSVSYNIVLCGFMGCGKSTVGKILSKKLGFAFLDLDNAIENRSGMSISDIFKIYGEKYFRDLEHEEVRRVSNRKQLVISAGGGTLIYDRNVREICGGNNIIVFLDVSFNTVFQRLKFDKTRPLLQKPNREYEMKTLYESRIPIYRQVADLVINADCSPREVCDNIIKSLR